MSKTDATPAADRGSELSEGLGAASEARRWIVCWDDEMGTCWPMGRDVDCEGALCALHTGKMIAMFSSRAAARKAIKVSTAYAKLRKTQGLPPNDDFLEGIANVRIVECESA